MPTNCEEPQRHVVYLECGGLKVQKVNQESEAHREYREHKDQSGRQVQQDTRERQGQQESLGPEVSQDPPVLQERREPPDPHVPTFLIRDRLTLATHRPTMLVIQCCPIPSRTR